MACLLLLSSLYHWNYCYCSPLVISNVLKLWSRTWNLSAWTREVKHCLLIGLALPAHWLLANQWLCYSPLLSNNRYFCTNSLTGIELITVINVSPYRNDKKVQFIDFCNSELIQVKSLQIFSCSIAHCLEEWTRPSENFVKFFGSSHHSCAFAGCCLWSLLWVKTCLQLLEKAFLFAVLCSFLSTKQRFPKKSADFQEALGSSQMCLGGKL